MPRSAGKCGHCGIRSTMSTVAFMPPRSIKSFGRCIFCLDDKCTLTKEHIVPAALNGTWVIQKATCRKCQDRHTYERDTLKIDLLVPRVLLSLHGRQRDNKKPLELPLVTLVNHTYRGANLKLRLEPSEYPPIFFVPHFPPAGLLVGEVRGSDITQMGVAAVNLSGLLKRNARPRWDVDLCQTCISGALPKTVAKIAYCFAVSELGLDGFDGDAMRDFLSGRRDDIYTFVGGGKEEASLPRKYLHELQLRQQGPFQTALVGLFASCGAPTYEVVVGRVKGR